MPMNAQDKNPSVSIPVTELKFGSAGVDPIQVAKGFSTSANDAHGTFTKLPAAGAGPEHVVKVQVFMTDITERPKINPRRIAYFGENLPASTLVEVKGLVDSRMKVEIECQAYVD